MDCAYKAKSLKDKSRPGLCSTSSRAWSLLSFATRLIGDLNVQCDARKKRNPLLSALMYRLAQSWLNQGGILRSLLYVIAWFGFLSTVWAQIPPQGNKAVELLLRSGNGRILGPTRPLPLKINAEQAALLIEAPDLFSYVESDAPKWAYTAYWMDERRIISTMREIGQWRAAELELPKIVIFDTATQTLEETPYRGFLECFTPERMVVYPTVVNWGANRSANLWIPASRRHVVLAGKFGDVLREEEYPAYEAQFSKFTCKSYNGTKDFPGSDGYRTIPLRAEDGYLGSIFGPKNADGQQLTIFGPTGEVYKKIWVPRGRARIPFEPYDAYNTTTNRYFLPGGEICGDGRKGGAVVYDSVTFNVNGEVQLHPTPPLSANMADWCLPSSWGRRDTAAGIVYWPMIVFDPARDNPSYNRGVYIHLNGHTYRFFKEHVTVAAVSPSGCRVFVKYRPDTNVGAQKAFVEKARIFNVCEEGKK